MSRSSSWLDKQRIFSETFSKLLCLNQKQRYFEIYWILIKLISGSGGGGRLNHGLYSPPTNSIGLAGVGNLDDSDMTYLKLRANNVIVFLLHRDPVDTATTPRNGHEAENSDITEMSETFFSQIGEYSIQTLFGVNGDHLQENLLSVCAHDHIRYVCFLSTVFS